MCIGNNDCMSYVRIIFIFVLIYCYPDLLLFIWCFQVGSCDYVLSPSYNGREIERVMYGRCYDESTIDLYNNYIIVNEKDFSEVVLCEELFEFLIFNGSRKIIIYFEERRWKWEKSAARIYNKEEKVEICWKKDI